MLKVDVIRRVGSFFQEVSLIIWCPSKAFSCCLFLSKRYRSFVRQNYDGMLPNKTARFFLRGPLEGAVEGIGERESAS